MPPAGMILRAGVGHGEPGGGIDRGQQPGGDAAVHVHAGRDVEDESQLRGQIVTAGERGPTRRQLDRHPVKIDIRKPERPQVQIRVELIDDLDLRFRSLAAEPDC